MKPKYILLLTLLIASMFCGFGDKLEPGVLYPNQVDSSMIDQTVKVKGWIRLVVENPGGLGGLYLTLDNGELCVRIQPDVWNTLDADERARFREGKTITVEGTLFQAGEQLVIIYGKPPP